MNKNLGTLETVARHLVLAVQPLRNAVADLDSFKNFMYRLGWNVNSLPPSYAALETLVHEALLAFKTINDSPDEPDVVQVLGLLDKVRSLYRAIADLSEAPEGVEPVTFLEEIRERIFELLIVDYLAAALPEVYHGLVTLGIITLEAHGETEGRPPYLHVRLRYDQVSKLISNPLSIPSLVYGWGEDDLDTVTLFGHLREILEHTGGLVSFGSAPTDLVEGYAGTGAPRSTLKFTPFETFIAGELAEAAFQVFALPPDEQRGAGIVLQPVLPNTSELDYVITDSVSLHVRQGSDLSELFGILVQPGKVSVRYPFSPGNQLPAKGFGLSIEYRPDSASLLLGHPAATRLEMRGVTVSLELDHRRSELELRLGVSLENLTFVLATKEQDGFLKELLGGNDATLPIPFTIQWSNRVGLGFVGGTGFEFSYIPHLHIGPLSIQRVQFALRTTLKPEHPPDLITETGVSLGGQLGPIAFSIEDVGLHLVSVFEDGNAGPFDIAVGFKPPDGIGLSVDGGGFKGGGFLRFEPDEQRYAGMLELEYQERIELKAIGLLTTRLPGGEPGFSLLIIITTSEFTPINLGLGFTLNGVGGLLGLNRTARVERLRTGLRDNTLSSILFPENLIANADRILSDLRQVFPPQDGRFLFGPMAKIGWGSPTLITVDLGLLIEVPQPVRVFILGVARALLPDEKAKLLQLQVNFLGEIDFERELFAFDASLFDSKLLTYPLSGDMAARLKWGDSDPNFLLTFGGFHPAYDPPPLGLPVLRRLTVQLLKGNNPRLVLETYFAITSNTAQFGARLELYAAAGKFNVYGFLSFDALFQFNPFYFIAEVAAMLALRVGSKSIASIQLALTLEGTTPWKAQGTATLKLCWFIKIKVRFNKTFGEVRDTRLDDVAVLPLLRAALADKGNWSAGIPNGRHLLVSVKEIEGLGDQVVAHPFGILEISQRVVPLNVDVQTFGNQRPADGNRFAIEQVRVGEPGDTETLDTSSVREQFAPAQFFEMSDAEKLSRKSFERYDGGVRVTASERLEAAYAAKRDVDYELFYIDSQRDQRLRPWFERLSPEAVAFNAWASKGAVAASSLSFASTGKSALAPEAVRVSQESFAVVNTSDLTLVRDDAVAFSEVGALGLMRELIRSNPALEGEIQVVPNFEINRS